MEYVCPHCGKTVTLDRLTRECSNCFGCVGCEQHVCPACGILIIMKAPNKPKKKD